jgi:hypothetical protein
MSVIYTQGGGSASIADATTTTSGKVRLATIAEASGTSELIAVTPAGLQAELAGIVGGLTYKGAFSASESLPDLSNALQGDFYRVSTAGVVFGVDWQVGDQLIVNADMGGTIDNAKIDKIDNTESISVLTDLLDVAISAEADGQVLVYDGTGEEWVNRELTVADVLNAVTQADHDALAARVTTNEGDISSIDGRLTTAEGSITSLGGRMTTAEGDISSLDGRLTTAEGSITGLQSELDATQSGAGLTSGGAYIVDGSSNYLTSATNLADADTLLDAKLKETRDIVDTLGANSVSSVNGVSPVSGDVTVGGADIDTAHTATNYTASAGDLDAHLSGVDTELGTLASDLSTESTNRADGDSAIQSELDATQQGAGLETNGAYVANVSANYISAVSSLKGADEALDAKLKETRDLVDNLGANSVASVNGISPVAGDVTLTATDITGFATVATSGAYADLSGTPTLATVATSGEYSDLLNKPTLGTASAEDVGTGAGDVVQLDGSARLPAVDGSQLTNLTVDLSSGSVSDLGDVAVTSATNGDALIFNGTSSQWENSALATVATSGDYTDLSNTPALATVATSGDYTDLSNTPALATVATSGAASDVSVAATPTNYTALSANVEAHLTAIDTALASVGAVQTVNGVSPVGGDITLGGADIDTAHSAVNYTAGAADLDSHLSGVDSKLGALDTQVTTNTSNIALKANSADLGTASTQDVGTGAGDVVQLDGSARLPAVDGSQLTNLTVDLSTGALNDLGDVSITAAADGDALVFDGANWRDLALATVATSGDYTDLLNAPTSLIGTATFDATLDAVSLEAGKHYIFGVASGNTKTITLPSVTANGEYIRVTNWGDGSLLLQVDQADTDAYLLVGQTITLNGQTTIESKATVDLFGFNYSQGGTDYQPAWGVYYASSIELNTRSFTTDGQLPVYDASKQELYAGDLGDLSLSFSATNYDETRGATVDGTKVIHHLGGIDDELGALDTALTTLDGEAVKSVNALTPTAGAVVLGGADIETAHTASDYTAAAADLDSHLAGIDTRLAEKVNAADGLDGLDDVDLTTAAPQDGEILLYNATSSKWEPNPPPAPLATETSVGLVEYATDAETTTGTADNVVLRPSNISSIEISSLLNAGTSATADTGTAIGDVVALEDVGGSAGLPAVDGSQLTGISVAAPPVNAATGGTITVPTGSEAFWIMSPTADTAVTLNSPTAGAPGTGDDGKKLAIKNYSAFELTLNGSIDGDSSFVLSAENSAITLVAYNGGWYIV